MHRLDEHTDPVHVWQILIDAQGYRAFDIGANIGQSTRVLAKNFVQVIALEPCKESYQFLSQEKAINVIAIPYAASSHGGVVTLNETATHIPTGQLTTGEGLHLGPSIGVRSLTSLPLYHLAHW